MARETGIEWTDATWNPIRGCSRVSEGCRHCYAEVVANRFCGPGSPYEGLVRLGADGKGTGQWNGEIKFVEERLLDPLRWKKPQRIFVNSMSDLFHEKVYRIDLQLIFAVMLLCPQHTFQVLTKRAGNMQAILTEPGFRSEVMATAARLAFDMQSLKVYARIPKPSNTTEIVYDCGKGGDEAGCRVQADWPLPNVWLGVSVENQQAADERIPLLLQTPAAVRFLSVEPLLGPVDLRAFVKRQCGLCEGSGSVASERGGGRPCPRCYLEPMGSLGTEYPLDWVICGGESGPGARPMHPDWARSLRDQCAAAGVPFFFKQWGEWKSGDQELAPNHGVPSGSIPPEKVCWHQTDGRTAPCGTAPIGFDLAPKNLAIRVGKKAAGHLLDGVEHHAFPEVRA